MRRTAITLFAGTIGCALALQIAPAEAGTTKESILHSFGNGTDGQDPEAGLVEVKGVFYGTTAAGGVNGGVNYGGTVFSLDPKTGTESVVYSFCSQPNCTDGLFPYAGLINVKGMLFGTTTSGGAAGQGTVFSIDPKTGAEKVVYSFCSLLACIDGQSPFGGLIAVNGTLYGTTRYGGTYRYGTVFAVDPGTGAETVLYSFCADQNCADGGNPGASLIDVNGTLYGTTAYGGTAGTVFALDLSTGKESVLYSFCSQLKCADGAGPSSSLIDVSGILFGTTLSGGANTDPSCDGGGCGTVFTLNPNTGAETVLYSFCSQQNCADGASPVGGLIDV